MTVKKQEIRLVRFRLSLKHIFEMLVTFKTLPAGFGHAMVDFDLT